MAFLKQQIKEQKMLDMEVDFESVLRDKEISERTMIHSMDFSKDVFASEKEVREYLKAVYFAYEPNITEMDTEFKAVIFSTQQLNLDTELSVELRRGITAFAADLRADEQKEEIAFNTKVSFVGKLDTVDFSNGLPHVIEIARVAKGFHPRYGEIELTKEHLKSFVKNFNARVSDVDLAVNEDHEKKEAFGWYKDIWLSHDGQTLYGSIQWNNKGVSALSEKDYRYFSPEFQFNYVHELNGVEYGPTLLGGALTNYPFLKMNAIIELNNKNKKQKDEIVEKDNQTIDLSVHTSQVVELNGKINNLQVELNAKTAENNTLAEEVKTLKNEIELNTKKQAHQKLFDEGHINASQLTALNEGKGMLEVLSLNSKMNTEAKGAAGSKEVVELNATDKKVAEQMGLTEEEYQAIKL